jgi:hypothetical protein
VAQEKWIVDGDKVLDIDGVRKLKIGLISGQVDVVGHDEPVTRVEINSVHGRDIRVTMTDGTLEISHTQWHWGNLVDLVKSLVGTYPKAHVSVRVPRDIALTFGIVSASGLVSGLTGDAEVNTVSGDLLIDGHTGALKLNGVSGEMSVRGHSGSITAHTVSGDVAATGAITTFSADTVSGDVFLDFAGIPDLAHINTVSGNVAARLESGVPALFTLNTVSGRVQLDDANITGVRGGYIGRFGELDKSWLDFKANTVSGNISVLHAVSA